MKLSFELPDDFLSTEEINDLKQIFGNKSDDEFILSLSKIATASLAEYKQMLLGLDLPSRADEIRQHRLLQLIKYYYCERIPNESEVSIIFQLPDSKSRSLITYTTSRFRHELAPTITKTLKQLIASAKKIDNELDFEVIIQSKFVVEELNRIIQQKASYNQKIYPKPGAAGIFIIPADTMMKLQQILGIKNNE